MVVIIIGVWYFCQRFCYMFEYFCIFMSFLLFSLVYFIVMNFEQIFYSFCYVLNY